MHRQISNPKVIDYSLRAALWTLLGALFFSLMNATVKYLGILDQQITLAPIDDAFAIPIFQVTFARYAVATILIFPFMFGNRSSFRVSSPFRYLSRTIAGFGGIALMFAAIQIVPLASATAIGFTSPIFAMIFSALLLREWVPRLRWVAAIIGLSGAMIIASPGSGIPMGGALLALCAAAFMGAEVVGVKWLARTPDATVTILFFSNLCGTLLSACFMLPNFVWPSPFQVQVLLLVGLLATMGQTCFIRAAKMADANFMAPFFYVSLFYAALIGFLVFNETVSLLVVTGCLVILASALIMMNVRPVGQPKANDRPLP